MAAGAICCISGQNMTTHVDSTDASFWVQTVWGIFWNYRPSLCWVSGDD